MTFNVLSERMRINELKEKVNQNEKENQNENLLCVVFKTFKPFLYFILFYSYFTKDTFFELFFFDNPEAVGSHPKPNISPK
jgi:hypothetical protein